MVGNLDLIQFILELSDPNIQLNIKALKEILLKCLLKRRGLLVAVGISFMHLLEARAWRTHLFNEALQWLSLMVILLHIELVYLLEGWGYWSTSIVSQHPHLFLLFFLFLQLRIWVYVLPCFLVNCCFSWQASEKFCACPAGSSWWGLVSSSSPSPFSWLLGWVSEKEFVVFCFRCGCCLYGYCAAVSVLCLLSFCLLLTEFLPGHTVAVTNCLSSHCLIHLLIWATLNCTLYGEIVNI